MRPQNHGRRSEPRQPRLPKNMNRKLRVNRNRVWRMLSRASRYRCLEPKKQSWQIAALQIRNARSAGIVAWISLLGKPSRCSGANATRDDTKTYRVPWCRTCTQIGQRLKESGASFSRKSRPREANAKGSRPSAATTTDTNLFRSPVKLSSDLCLQIVTVRRFAPQTSNPEQSLLFTHLNSRDAR